MNHLSMLGTVAVKEKDRAPGKSGGPGLGLGAPEPTYLTASC